MPKFSNSRMPSKSTDDNDTGASQAFWSSSDVLLLYENVSSKHYKRSKNKLKHVCFTKAPIYKITAVIVIIRPIFARWKYQKQMLEIPMNLFHFLKDEE